MSPTTLTELAQRRDDGLEITLFWAPVDDSVQVSVVDERTGSTVAFPVDRARALDAFYHPFVYAARAQSHPPHVSSPSRGRRVQTT